MTSAVRILPFPDSAEIAVRRRAREREWRRHYYERERVRADRLVRREFRGMQRYLAAVMQPMLERLINEFDPIERLRARAECTPRPKRARWAGGWCLGWEGEQR